MSYCTILENSNPIAWSLVLVNEHVSFEFAFCVFAGGFPESKNKVIKYDV